MARTKASGPADDRPAGPFVWSRGRTYAATHPTLLDGSIARKERVSFPCEGGLNKKFQNVKSETPGASPRHCRASFHRLFCLGRSIAHSCRRRRASQSIRIGGCIQFAPIEDLAS